MRTRLAPKNNKTASMNENRPFAVSSRSFDIQGRLDARAVKRIGHFRVHVCLIFKASLSAKFLMVISSSLHMNGN